MSTLARRSPRITSSRNCRRDLEQPVRLERVRARRPHVMQRQDRADAAEQRAQQPVSAGEIQRLHSGAQNDLLQVRPR